MIRVEPTTDPDALANGYLYCVRDSRGVRSFETNRSAAIAAAERLSS